MIEPEEDVVVVGAGIEEWMPIAKEHGLVTTSLDISGFRFSRFAEGAIGPPRSVL